ncbi:MAG: hypothetical protein HRT72_09850 [Flavobacteriales bacterium]|nr:hypothetical protein [Flavobacteriales bacterium]
MPKCIECGKEKQHGIQCISPMTGTCEIELINLRHKIAKTQRMIDRQEKNTIERLERMVAQAVDLPKGVEPHEWSDYKRSKEI